MTINPIATLGTRPVCSVPGLSGLGANVPSDRPLMYRGEAKPLG